jgi:hypothetical protein
MKLSQAAKGFQPHAKTLVCGTSKEGLQISASFTEIFRIMVASKSIYQGGFIPAS